jgi:hypothetical protein
METAKIVYTLRLLWWQTGYEPRNELVININCGLPVCDVIQTGSQLPPPSLLVSISRKTNI